MEIGLIIEAFVLLGLSSLGVWEGIRLLRQEHLLGDPIGPGGFLAFTSIVLLAGSIIYFFGKFQKAQALEAKDKTKGLLRFGTAAYLLAVLGLYAATVPYVGYALGTGVFFILSFHISGVKNWGWSIGLGLIAATVFELFFSRLAKIPLP